MSKVLVTGGTGFVGGHAIAQLLAAGHEVRTTIRNPARAPAGVQSVVADLTSDAGWAAAMQGCDFVLHIASPMASASPKDENDLIAPARDGTLRVLRFARDAGVKRVVVTSSFAAVGYGHAPREQPFTEEDWTNPDGADVQPYMRSKVLAERAAWDFVEREGNGLELAVVNPVGIFGPALGRDLSDSIRIVQQMLGGAIPICPRVYFGVVDVRDAIDLHLRAMTAPEAKGERFIAVAGDAVSLLDVAKILRARLGEAAKKAPRRELPDWLVRALALVMPPFREVVPQLGMLRRSSNAKAKRVLGWSPRSTEDAIAATGESLLRLAQRP